MNAAPAAAPAHVRPAWGVVIGVMLTALLEVLDTTVVNVALPHMMGSFGATPDQITWMITAYLVSTAIVMPLTGYLVRRFGRRVTLFVGVVGFILTSAACGVSWSLHSMVAFRFLQGGFGAVLVPISQSILLDAFPREKRNQAMAIWGVAIMAGPIMGPVLGGLITEHWSWRWVFYINVPIGVIAIVLMLDEVGGTPPEKHVSTDWTGLALLSIALGAFQTLLDQGHTRDWFESGFIWTLAWVAGSAFVLFVVRALGREHNIVDIRLFADRNFAAGNLLMAGYGLAMYSTIVMWPLLAQDVLGYPADVAGWVLAPRGVVSAVMMIAIGTWLAPHVDNRWLIGAGLLISAYASSMMARLSLGADMFALIAPGLVFGFGMAAVFSQLSTVTFETIAPEKGADAAGLYNVMRTMGGSIGIAITSTLLVRREQVHWRYLGEHVSATNPRLYDWMAEADIALDEPNAPARLVKELFQHVQMGAFNDVFWTIAGIFICLAPCVLLLGHRRRAV
ncbi:MAG: DHA2 family efflux MFS transporter permease subunit [Gammaproteobacteria bacterium]|uniref:DHA2 family efflux MFS transporter permease subunit n=1 Tax=Algiphilus sp. TaxID=1872431 RepID=UPI0032EA931A